MTELTFEERVARWYRPWLDDEPLPERLRVRVLALPDRRWQGSADLHWTSWPRSQRILAVALLAAALLGLAMGAAAGMLPRWVPQRVLAFPAELDACAVLRTAVSDPRVMPNGSDGDHGMTTWGAHVCVNDAWDSGYNYRHLLLRTQPTSLPEAMALVNTPSNWAIPDEGRGEFADPLPAVWRPFSVGVWAGIAAADAGGSMGMAALAVSREPYFFIVTGRSQSEVLEDARRVASVLGVALGDVAAEEWPPIILPVPTMWRP